MTEPLSDRSAMFSPTVNNFQVAWDSTSLGLLKECPRKYHYQIIQGFQPRGLSIHLRFGLLFHSGLEQYDHTRSRGEDHETALRAMVRYALEASMDTAEDGTRLPWDSQDEFKNRYTLLRSLVWYVEEKRDSPLQTVILANGKPAVELSFAFHAFDIGDDPISLCGHIDKLVRDPNGTVWVLDHKAQPINCKVLGPHGWLRIGELQVGDQIAGRDGFFHSVTALYPKGFVDTYLITFQDGSQTFCAADHLWEVTVDPRPYTNTMTTLEVIETMKKRRVHVPVNDAIDHPTAQLPVDPYLLGALLGDGYLGGNSVAITTSRQDVIQGVDAACERMGDIFRKSPADNLVYTITNNRDCATLRGLRELNLWGHKSATKFIPDRYLFASIEQRRELLAGLLDTDGSWDRDYRRYQTISPQLAKDVAALVRSLGGTCAISSQRAREGLRYRVQIRLGERGIPVRKRYFKSLEKVEPQQCVCIEVDAPDHLYVTDDYIVTHNTTKSALSAYWFKSFTPHNQFSLYTIAGKTVLAQDKLSGVLVNGAQIGVGFTRFALQPAPRPQAVLNEWLADAKYWIAQARAFALADHWPLNDRSCGNYGGCAFAKVCAVSPSHRKAWLESDFMHWHWDPTVARGDV